MNGLLGKTLLAGLLGLSLWAPNSSASCELPSIQTGSLPEIGTLDEIRSCIADSKFSPYISVQYLMRAFRDEDALTLIRENELSGVEDYGNGAIIDLSAFYGSVATFKWLSLNDAGLEQRNNWEEEALLWAVDGGAKEIIDLLLPRVDDAAKAKSITRAAERNRCTTFALLANTETVALSDDQLRDTASALTKSCTDLELGILSRKWDVSPILESEIPIVLHDALLNRTASFNRVLLFWISLGAKTEDLCNSPENYVEYTRSNIDIRRQRILDSFLERCGAR